MKSRPAAAKRQFMDRKGTSGPVGPEPTTFINRDHAATWHRSAVPFSMEMRAQFQHRSPPFLS